MKKIKRTLSLVLALCLLGNTITWGSGKYVAYAENAATEETSTNVQDLSAISFDTFGIEDKTVVGEALEKDTTGTENAKLKYWLGDTGAYKNSIFSGYFTFEGESEKAVIFGGTKHYNGEGFRMLVSKDGKTLTFDSRFISTSASDVYRYVLAEDVGLKSFNGVKTKISISFEASGENLKLSVYINDALTGLRTTKSSAATEKTWTVTGAYSEAKAAHLGNHIYLIPGKDASGEWCEIQIASCKPEGYVKEITFADFGLEDAQYCTTNGKYEGTYPGIMKNVMVKGDITYNNKSGSVIYIGNKADSGENGIMLFNYPGTIIAYPENKGTCYNAQGEHWCESTEIRSAITLENKFELSVSAEPWDYDGDGVKTDGKIEVRINGILFNGMYFIKKDMFQEAGANGQIILTDNGYSGAYITANSKADIPKNLKKLDASDFGWQSGTSLEENPGDISGHIWYNTSTPDSILNTVFKTKVTITSAVDIPDANKDKGALYFRYASPDADGKWNGLAFDIKYNGESMAVYSTEAAWTTHKRTIPASEVTKSGNFLNEAFEMAFVTTLEDLDGNGTFESVGFGLWINNHFCDKFYIENYVSKGFGNNLKVIYDPEWAGSVNLTLSDVKEDKDEFTPLALENMSGINSAGVYAQNRTVNPEAITTKSPDSISPQYTNMDGIYFSTNIRFSKGQVYMYYGGNATQGKKWYALRLQAEDTTQRKLQLVYPIDSSNTYKKEIDEVIAGTKLYDKTFRLGISTRNVDSDGDGYADDLQIGIWFNDRLYNNEYLYFVDKADALESSLTVYSAGEEGQIVFGDYVQSQPTEKVHCADEYAYVVSGDKVTVRDVTYDNGYALSMPGVYDVAYTEGNSTFKEKVTVYRTDDINGNGKADIVDLVGLLKYEAGQKTLDTVGEYAIGVKDGTYNFETRKASVYSKLLADTNIIGAKVFSNDGVRETGSNTSITAIGTTEEGTSVLSISDNAKTSTYTTDVACFNGSGLDYVLDFDTDRQIKVLQ